jgi:hypothetical protein
MVSFKRKKILSHIFLFLNSQSIIILYLLIYFIIIFFFTSFGPYTTLGGFFTKHSHMEEKLIVDEALMFLRRLEDFS